MAKRFRQQEEQEPAQARTVEAVALIREADGVRPVRVLCEESCIVDRAEPTLLASALERARRWLIESEERNR